MSQDTDGEHLPTGHTLDEVEVDWRRSDRYRTARRTSWLGFVSAAALLLIIAVACALLQARSMRPGATNPLDLAAATISSYGAILVVVLLLVSLPIVVATAVYVARQRELFEAERLFARDRGIAHEMAAGDLKLARLWQLNQDRINIYHDLTTRHARSSFRNGQAAISLGMLVLIGSLVVVLLRQEVATAVAAAAIATVGSALAGYVGQTYLRIHEQSINQLRAYFEQPLQFSRVLSAERLLNRKMSNELRDDLLRYLVQATIPPASPPLTPSTGSD